MEKVWKDHLDNEYSTKLELCSAYGITISAYNNRIKKGWDLERVLTTPVKDKSNKIVFNGVEYASFNHLARAFKIDTGTLKARLRKGMSLSEALETYVVIQEIECRDHLDNIYRCQADMARAWGVKPVTLRARLAKGMSVEEALTGIRQISVVDHNNKEYKTIDEMCKYYGITAGLFRKRLSSGMSKEEALTLDSRRRKFTDITGKSYSSMAELASAWDINYSIIRGRLSRNDNISAELIVALIMDKANNSNRVVPTFIGLDGKAYYNVRWADEVVTTRDVIKYYRPDLLDAYDKSNPTGEYKPYIRE